MSRSAKWRNSSFDRLRGFAKFVPLPLIDFWGGGDPSEAADSWFNSAANSDPRRGIARKINARYARGHATLIWILLGRKIQFLCNKATHRVTHEVYGRFGFLAQRG